MKTHLYEFIRLKISEVEKSIIAREQSKEAFSRGTNKEWNQAAIGTGTKPMSKSDRIKVANRECRILIKLKKELALFNEVLDALISMPPIG